MTRTLAALIAFTAVAGTAALAPSIAGAQDFPEVFPTPREPTRSQSRLSAVPGTIEGDVRRGGLSFDLFSGAPVPQTRCEQVFGTVNGVRTLVSVRCSDDR